MATIPYQPTYTTDPKYGLRYGPSQFAPTQGEAGAGSASAKPVPTAMTTGAGGYSVADPFISEPAFQPPQPSVGIPAPEQEQYATPVQSGVSPTATYGGIDVSNNSTIGFRTQQAGGGMAPPPVIDNPYDYTPPKSQLRVADPFAGLSGFSDGAGEQLAFDNSSVASQYGYKPTEPSVAGLMGFVPGGSLISGALGINDNYGADGTYDSQGNVFSGGRAYNPVTGKPAQSFSNRGTYYDNLKDSYGSLRDAGEGMLSSGLGSYENSVYNQMAMNPDLDLQGARYARDRGVSGSNVMTTASIIQNNMSGEGSDLDGPLSVNITPEMLGFQGNRMGEPTTISGKFGYGENDIVPVGNEFGVRNADGSISTPSGTVIQITDSTTNKSLSLISQDPLTQAKVNAELARKSGDATLINDTKKKTNKVQNIYNKAKDLGVNTSGKSITDITNSIVNKEAEIKREQDRQRTGGRGAGNDGTNYSGDTGAGGTNEDAGVDSGTGFSTGYSDMHSGKGGYD